MINNCLLTYSTWSVQDEANVTAVNQGEEQLFSYLSTKPHRVQSLRRCMFSLTAKVLCGVSFKEMISYMKHHWFFFYWPQLLVDWQRCTKTALTVINLIHMGGA